MASFRRTAIGPEKVQVREIHFLGEQDGPPERILKSRLNDLFLRDGGGWRGP
jgi:hypothetical protein